MIARDARPAVLGRPVLLLLSDDRDLRQFFETELGATYEVLFASNADQALFNLRRREVALVVVYDSGGAATDAFAVREQLVAEQAVPVILMTAQGSEDRAVEALKRGFNDYIVKRGAIQSDLFRKRIESNLELARLKRDNEWLRQAIEESQARLFNIYDSLDDVIMQIDEDCRVVSLNRSAAALANREPKDAVGQICYQLFDFYPCEARAKKECCHIYRTFVEGETIRGERKDPKTKAVHQYMTFITTLKEKDYTVYRETDITEKRRLEERIANALESLGVRPERTGPGGEPKK